MRMSRRMGLVGITLPSLYEFWSDATVVVCSGASSSTAFDYSDDITIGDTSTPLWLLTSKGDAFELSKIKNTAKSWERNFQANDANGWVEIVRASTTTTASTKIQVNAFRDLQGYIVAALRFSHFSEAVVDKMLKKMEFEFLANAYRNNATASSVYIADADLSSDQNDVYLQFACSSSAGYISATRGGTPGTAIMSSGSGAFWRHYNSRYYFSNDGTSNMTTRAGGLYRITL